MIFYTTEVQFKFLAPRLLSTNNFTFDLLVEHVEATWGLFYHLAAQTHT